MDTPTPRMDLIDVCERLRRINSHQTTHERAVAIIERQERELAALRAENAHLQSELDASCNAEELRQMRAENAGLKELLTMIKGDLECRATLEGEDSVMLSNSIWIRLCDALAARRAG